MLFRMFYFGMLIICTISRLCTLNYHADPMNPLCTLLGWPDYDTDVIFLKSKSMQNKRSKCLFLFYTALIIFISYYLLIFLICSLVFSDFSPKHTTGKTSERLKRLRCNLKKSTRNWPLRFKTIIRKIVYFFNPLHKAMYIYFQLLS